MRRDHTVESSQTAASKCPQDQGGKSSRGGASCAAPIVTVGVPNLEVGSPQSAGPDSAGDTYKQVARQPYWARRG